MGPILAGTISDCGSLRAAIAAKNFTSKFLFNCRGAKIQGRRTNNLIGSAIILNLPSRNIKAIQKFMLFSKNSITF